MGYTAQQLIEEAQKWIGYKEKKSNAQLDDFEANAGPGNWTCFARDLRDAGYYNGNKNGYSWCAIWVDAMHYYASGKDKKEAQRVTCQSGVYGAVCTYHANYFRAEKRFDQSPQVGDCIYFKSAGDGFSHIGIVEAVDDKYVHTIEGNASDCVCRKKYLRTNSKIGGYGHPRYEQKQADDEQKEPVDEQKEPVDEQKEPVDEQKEDKTDTEVADATGTVCSVKALVVRQGSRGPSVRSAQALLNLKTGAGLELDGSFGPLTKAATLKWQKACGLDQDGVIGKDTWASLINAQ